MLYEKKLYLRANPGDTRLCAAMELPIRSTIGPLIGIPVDRVTLVMELDSSLVRRVSLSALSTIGRVDDNLDKM